MARTRTLTELIAEVRERGDFRSVRHPDADITRRINQSIAELYDLLVSVNQDYFLDSDDISVVSGTDSYSLDTAFFKVLGVDVQFGSNWYPVRKFQWAERNQYQDGGTSQRDVRYRIMGQKLYLRPTPRWSGTVRVWFIPAPTVLSAGSDTFDGISGWEEYVIVDCVIKGKLKDEEPADEWMAIKGQLAGRIRDLAAERDPGEPDRVRDVFGEYQDNPDYWNP